MFESDLTTHYHGLDSSACTPKTRFTSPTVFVTTSWDPPKSSGCSLGPFRLSSQGSDLFTQSQSGEGVYECLALMSVHRNSQGPNLHCHI